MADYNVNMKQWNGSSFDNVLPLAYNSNQLGGQSLSEVKQWVKDNGLLLYTGQYTGTGTYGASNPNSITFPFPPVLLLFPRSSGKSSYAADTIGVLPIEIVDTSYNIFRYIDYIEGSSTALYIKIDSDKKTFYWYSTQSSSNQQNISGNAYFFAVIGGYDMGGSTEWTITSSGSWTVPKTGRYLLELYGGGGGTSRSGGKAGYTGGSSCQHYDSVTLTLGDTFDVTIGAGGDSSTVTSYVTDGGVTTFGSYSVSGGGKSVGSAGTGAGNYGKVGSYQSSSSGTRNYNDGALGQIYGCGAAQNNIGATDGAVYLKYLGD